MLKEDVTREAAEERNPLTDENGHARNDETVDESRAQKPLNRDPSVDVHVVGATGGERGSDLSRRPAHVLDDASTDGGQVDGATRENHYALVAVGPGRTRERSRTSYDR